MMYNNFKVLFKHKYIGFVFDKGDFRVLSLKLIKGV